MPEITDPILLAQIANQHKPNVQPQPFPGAMAPPLEPSPMRQLQQQKTQQGMGLDANQDARAARALQLQEDANRRAEIKALQEKTKLDATGGVDTTESESTAAFLTSRLEGDVKKINEVFKQFPEAMKPGWAETVGGLFGERARSLATPDKVVGARTILNGRFRDAVDTLLTLGTGAAYTKEQRADYIENFAPQVTDQPEVLEDKRQRLREAIIAARTKSGAAVGQVDRALAEIDKLYSTTSGEPATPETKPEYKSSTDTKVVPYPTELQQEHQAFLSQHPPGQLDLRDYYIFRSEQAKKIPGAGIGGLEDFKAYVDAYNKGNATSTVPPIEQRMSGTEAGIAGAMDTSVGSFLGNAANAGLGGLPELLAGESGREALRARNEEHGTASTIGDIAGSIVPVMGLEALGVKALGGAAKLSSRGALGVDMAANAAYGAGRGATGAEDGKRLDAALSEGALGAAGSVAGNALVKGARPFRSKVTNGAIDQLDGVELTNPQLMGAGRLEEAVRGIPGPHGARERALESFNKDLVNRQLKHAGVELPKEVAAGTEAVGKANELLNAGYEAVKPKLVGGFDGDFATNLAAIKAASQGTKQKKELYKEILAIQNKFLDPSGQYNGDLVKDAMTALRDKAHDWNLVSGSGSDSEYKAMAKEADKLRKSILGLVMRNTPEDGAKLKGLDRAWAGMKRVEHGTAAALAHSEGLMSPGQYLNSIKIVGGPSAKTAAARGRGLDQEYAEAAAKVLGSKGTTDVAPGQTALATSLTVGGGFTPAAPVAAGIGGTAALLYAPGVRKFVAGLLKGNVGKTADKIPMPKSLEDIPSETLAALIAQSIRANVSGE